MVSDMMLGTTPPTPTSVSLSPVPNGMTATGTRTESLPPLPSVTVTRAWNRPTSL